MDIKTEEIRSLLLKQIKKFDVEIAKLRSSGELNKILAKYGISDWK